MTSTTWQDGLQRLLRRIDETGERVTDGFPHYGNPATGQWTTSPGGDWTGGFWNGLCWLAAHHTGEARYRHWAQQWTERLRPRADSDTIFRGFLFYYGAVLGSVLLADPLAHDVALEGAQGLAACFNPQAGVLPLGTEAEEASVVGRGESSIDGVQGAALLVWAMVGYAVMYLWTREREFLEVAMRTADWWMVHAPVDRVAFWDFDAPAGPDTPRDTSGTAIAAAALLKLAALAPEETQRARYQAAAEATVAALVERYLDERGILCHGNYNKRISPETLEVGV